MHEQCLHPERWQKFEDALKRIEEKIDRLDDNHDDLHKRMFVGNGQPAFVATLKEHDQTLRALVWTTGTVVASMIACGVGLVIHAAFRYLAGRPG